MKKRLQHLMNRTTALLLAGLICANLLLAGSSSFAAASEVRAVWISYFELETLLKNKNETEFRSAVSAMFSRLSKDQMNTVMVHVRPFGDALYQSDLFPTSYLMTGTEGDPLAYDPLKIMIEEAKTNQLKLEAWINPYRVRINTVKAPISTSNRVNEWLADGSNRAVKLTSGTFYNPSDARVTALVVDGVKELLSRYELDGIHFDDYFYPTTAASFDKRQYDAYVKAGGKLKLADFRREQINQMVQAVYKACKTAKRPVRFGISPQGLIQNNYDAQYADVKKWVSQKGYVDYICPQIYYGLKNTKAPFMTVLKDWDNLTKKSAVEVYIGLAPYKIGLEDKWSGGGKKEWQTDQQILRRMVEASRKITRYKGFALFRYDSLWNPADSVKSKAHLERESLIALCLGK